MGNKYHILIIDDDDKIRDLLKQYLMKNDFFVSVSEDTKSARLLMGIYKFDIMIVDFMMPNETGAEFIKSIKETNKVPIIMLTALGDIDNKVECFEGGANDYMVKPFEPKELILRINNLIKREKINEPNIVFGEYIFDLNKGILKNNQGVVYLTDIETKLMSIFTKNLNYVLTRDELVEYFSDMNERSIDVAIARLRKKIEVNQKQPQFLRTIRNQGYILNN